ncbi:KTSC domain-containing protein [Sphingobacterium thalpophilum]|uniref:KTSC domain-containing protein n=1 Tax=Sphingobacterium thalpophilum TaxID=259 RepID=UPI003D968DAC
MKKLTFYDVDYKVDERYEDYAVFKLPSSNVNFCGHKQEEGKDTHLFFVQYMNGGTYLYRDIPADVVQNASLAESIGKYVRENISGKTPGTKLDGPILKPYV